ncbi:hypothetical protein [Bartonella apihabitans]|nr:hypothetical protein [Bartonella apihabitans]
MTKIDVTQNGVQNSAVECFLKNGMPLYSPVKALLIFLPIR